MNFTWNLVLLIFAFYWMIVIILKSRGILDKYNISTFGPIMMIRTEKCLKTVDALSKPKLFWHIFGDVGIFLMFAGMLAMFAVIILADYSLVSAYLDGTVPAVTKANEVQNLLLIPGLNDFIPFNWGLIALIITLVVHEFSHAIMSRAENIRVKSMGILYALFPIGGFAEIDEKELFGITDEQNKNSGNGETDDGFNDLTATIEEIREHEALMKAKEEAKAKSLENAEALENAEVESANENVNADATSDSKISETPKKATKHQRARILSAGVMANFCTAFIAFCLFFGILLGCIAPAGNFLVSEVADNSQAQSAGLVPDMLIKEINGISITTPSDFKNATQNISPGDLVEMTVSDHGEIKKISYAASAGTVSKSGVNLLTVISDSPADRAGLKENMTIIAVNGIPIMKQEDFADAMSSVLPGDSIELTIIDEPGSESRNLTMTAGSNPDIPEKAYMGITYVGADQTYEISGAQITYFNSEAYLTSLKMIPQLMAGIVPEGSEATQLQAILAGWIILLSLPFFGLAGEGFTGFNDTLMNFYQTTGDAASLGTGIFWIANILLWIGWMNFYVGLFNCLPSLPLDGGHVFRAAIQIILEKLNIEEKKAETGAAKICLLFTTAIIVSFVFMIVWPYIGDHFL